MYLPDSNVIIQALKGHEPEASFIRDNIISRSIKISVVVVAEFLVKATEEQIERFNSILKEFGTLSIDEETARIAADYRKQFIRKSKRVFLLDCFLAAQARIHDHILVTNNFSDFPFEDIKTVFPQKALN